LAGYPPPTPKPTLGDRLGNIVKGLENLGTNLDRAVNNLVRDLMATPTPSPTPTPDPTPTPTPRPDIDALTKALFPPSPTPTLTPSPSPTDLPSTGSSGLGDLSAVPDGVYNPPSLSPTPAPFDLGTIPFPGVPNLSEKRLP
jgi:hypothetical protein